MSNINLPLATPIRAENEVINTLNNSNSNNSNNNNNQNNNSYNNNNNINENTNYINGLPVVQANPVNEIIHSQPQPYLQTQFVGTEKMAFSWRLGKTVKFFAVIDIFFCLLYLMIYPPLALISILPLIGYYGAREYNICKTYLYGFFVFLNLIVRSYSYTLANNFGEILLCLFSIMIEAWILRIIYSFISSIKQLTTSELLQLKEPNWEPLQTNLVWF